MSQHSEIAAPALAETLTQVETPRPPKIFIVGTMKGGTTILYDYLCEHPLIRPGKVKEVHYFSLYPHRPLAWYLDHFADVGPDQQSIDASPTYFDATYTAAVPHQIKALVPDARVILVVRDPVERAISHYVHLKHTVKVPGLQAVDANQFFARDFLEAFRQLSDVDFYLQQVLWFSLYCRKFQIFRQVFAERLLVLQNDDLRAPKCSATMERVFGFLGLPSHPSEAYGRERYVTAHLREPLDAALRGKLEAFLYPDYRAFRMAAGLATS